MFLCHRHSRGHPRYPTVMHRERRGLRTRPFKPTSPANALMRGKIVSFPRDILSPSRCASCHLRHLARPFMAPIRSLSISWFSALGVFRLTPEAAGFQVLPDLVQSWVFRLLLLTPSFTIVIRVQLAEHNVASVTRRHLVPRATDHTW